NEIGENMAFVAGGECCGGASALAQRRLVSEHIFTNKVRKDRASRISREQDWPPIFLFRNRGFAQGPQALDKFAGASNKCLRRGHFCETGLDEAIVPMQMHAVSSLRAAGDRHLIRGLSAADDGALRIYVVTVGGLKPQCRTESFDLRIVFVQADGFFRAW